MKFSLELSGIGDQCLMGMWEWNFGDRPIGLCWQLSKKKSRQWRTPPWEKPMRDKRHKFGAATVGTPLPPDNLLGIASTKSYLDKVEVLIDGHPIATLKGGSLEPWPVLLESMALERPSVSEALLYCLAGTEYSLDLRERIELFDRVRGFLGTHRAVMRGFTPAALARGAFEGPRHEDEPLGYRRRGTGRGIFNDIEFQNGDQTLDEGILRFCNTQLILPGTAVAALLERLLYLGPVRDSPESIRAQDISAPGFSGSGRLAWHLLATYPSLLRKVNAWLKRKDLFGDPLEIVMERFSDGESPKKGSGPYPELKGALSYYLAVPRVRRKNDRLAISLHEVGAGIAQLVPFLTYALAASGQLILVEQPELHVHPKLQAELSDFLIEGTRGTDGRQNCFVVETHSEHLLLRLLRRLREGGKSVEGSGGLTADDIAVYYVDHSHREAPIREIRLSDDGTLLDPWPGGFFEESFREIFT